MTKTDLNFTIYSFPFKQDLIFEEHQYGIVTDDPPEDKDEILMDAAKKSGKQILTGFGKASMLFTKRVAEGAFNAQMKQSMEEETSAKLKVAGEEIGKAIIRGAVEGGSVGVTTILEGVNTFTKEMARHSKKDDDDSTLGISDS